VILERHLPIGLFDILTTGISSHSKHFVVIITSHHSFDLLTHAILLHCNNNKSQ
jgi:ribosomal protein S4E